jgi:hypothetical protein
MRLGQATPVAQALVGRDRAAVVRQRFLRAAIQSAEDAKVVVGPGHKLLIMRIAGCGEKIQPGSLGGAEITTVKGNDALEIQSIPAEPVIATPNGGSGQQLERASRQVTFPDAPRHIGQVK